jgi:hypothetical protein
MYEVQVALHERCGWGNAREAPALRTAVPALVGRYITDTWLLTALCSQPVQLDPRHARRCIVTLHANAAYRLSAAR